MQMGRCLGGAVLIVAALFLLRPVTAGSPGRGQRDGHDDGPTGATVPNAFVALVGPARRRPPDPAERHPGDGRRRGERGREMLRKR